MNGYFPLTLEGRHVRLEPLTAAHAEALVAAASQSRATYQFTGVPSDLASAHTYIDRALTEAGLGNGCPFATVDRRDGRVVGSTRFAFAERWVWPGAATSTAWDAVEIGFTWLAQSAQRTAINTEAKLLMLTHAFEVWQVKRVNLKTDERNARSRANIERIGGKLDGILRAHMPAFDGGLRSTAIYSLLQSEWPDNRVRLAGKLRGATDKSLTQTPCT